MIILCWIICHLCYITSKWIQRIDYIYHILIPRFLQDSPSIRKCRFVLTCAPDWIWSMHVRWMRACKLVSYGWFTSRYAQIVCVGGSITNENSVTWEFMIGDKAWMTIINQMFILHLLRFVTHKPYAQTIRIAKYITWPIMSKSQARKPTII